MIQIQSKISDRYQTVVPADIRDALHLKAGDKILWSIIKLGDQKKAIAEPQPKSWAAYSRGLGKSIWKGIDIDKYIKDLRDEWEE